MEYSKLLGWEVWNFMSIKHGRCDFDDKGIVNIKGYNDSGKSAMLMALRVLFTNYQSQKQSSFIRDNEDYFRVVAYFDDGVKIMRDKYINGQSLYEVYKGDDRIFTTKSSTGALTQVKGVPEPIKNYLGLIDSDDTYINFRSCFEKQIGVQTSGSENYKMFNNVLKSEEIATASALLNTDKNKLVSDIGDIENQLNAAKMLLGTTGGITIEMVDYLKSLDSNTEALQGYEEKALTIQSRDAELSSIHICPKLESVEGVTYLGDIVKYTQQIESISIAPELSSIQGVDILASIKATKDSIKEVHPHLEELDAKRLSLLGQIKSVMSSLMSITTEEIDSSISSLKAEIEELSQTSGIKTVKCPNCGEVVVC